MTTQEWAREARDLFKKIYDNEVSFFRCKEMGDLLAAYPEGESGHVHNLWKYQYDREGRFGEIDIPIINVGVDV